MDWLIGKRAYYADFFIVPLLVLAALVLGLAADPKTYAIALPVGAAGWTLAEYLIHRFVLHRIYRREHWAHHRSPARYIGVPPTHTTAIWLTLACGLWGTLPLGMAAGLYSGFLLGYLAYIAAHDRYHHGNPELWEAGYWRNCWARHRMHHHGVEANFGVLTPFWDALFGTYKNPPKGA